MGQRVLIVLCVIVLYFQLQKILWHFWPWKEGKEDVVMTYLMAFFLPCVVFGVGVLVAALGRWIWLGHV